MAEMICRTKGNSLPGGKARVYFTCHPADFDKYFDKICEDIFRTHDCAIYYTPDMTEVIREEEMDTDLGSNNLFVVPVSFCLLTEESRTMSTDFPYAKSHDIPVLPFMMEQGIDAIYSLPDRFGEMQYLPCCAGDGTEIAYQDKLKKYLDSVLFSDETAKRVRESFDAYIFLSYRKTDRRYANELMRLIHENPEYRDIAIWYDEFLTLGESFKKNIDKMLHTSKLFALLVTPHLLETPNFVMDNEYPTAITANIDILPTEMEPTDKEALRQSYDGIPDCVDPYDSEAFRQRLAESLSNLVDKENDSDPEHKFLIGLAYFEGIDMEFDRERGLSLMKEAAEEGCIDAMMQLDLIASTYMDQGHFQKALALQKLVLELLITHLGESDFLTLRAMNSLSLTFRRLGKYEKALSHQVRAYDLFCEHYGTDNQFALTALNNLAELHLLMGNGAKALNALQKVYDLRVAHFGEEDTNTLVTLNSLACTYGELGDRPKSLALHKKLFQARVKTLGENHLSTVYAMDNLATAYRAAEDYQNALYYHKKSYALFVELLGADHPDTLIALSNLAFVYNEMGNLGRSLRLRQQSYESHLALFGPDHPDTLIALSNLSVTNLHLGNLDIAMEQATEVLNQRKKVLGEKHPHVISAMHIIGQILKKKQDYRAESRIYEKVYSLCKMVYGMDNPHTIKAMDFLATSYNKQGRNDKALPLIEKIYTYYYIHKGPDSEEVKSAEISLRIFRKKKPE